MLELRQPLDIERIPEFRLLVDNLSARQIKTLTPMQVEAAAMFLWQRLWVDLGRLAQKTNKPGLLNAWGVGEFRKSVSGLFGDDVDPVQVFVDGPEALRSLTPLPAGEYQCDLFARLNSHLAGDFVTKEQKGNVQSIIARQQKGIQHDSLAQTMLFTQAFLKPDGTELVGADLNRCTVLIKNIDNAMGQPPRKTNAFTQGLYTDAWNVVAQDKKFGELQKFYGWLYLNQNNRSLPQSTEKILSEFEVYYKLSGV